MHSRNNLLTEGMRQNDLKDIVLPLLSVDEWTSKVDPDNAVVFCFYVHDRDAARDLDRFVQKSPVPLLDTDVSPAPDQHGFYLVFVELMRGDDLAANIAALLDEISPLADIDEWRMRVRKTDGLLTFSEKALAHCMARLARTDESAILKFLQPSDLLGATLDEGDLVIETSGAAMRFEIRGFGSSDEVLEELGLAGSAIGLSLREASRCQKLGALLGRGWYAHEMAGHTVVFGSDDDKVLVLRNL